MNSGRVYTTGPRNSASSAPVPDGHMTTREVCKLTGLTYRQLDHWCRQGYLGDDENRCTGSGHARLFTIREARRLDWISETLAKRRTIAELWLDSDQAVT